MFCTDIELSQKKLQKPALNFAGLFGEG